jgi:hypothetical protein
MGKPGATNMIKPIIVSLHLDDLPVVAARRVVAHERRELADCLEVADEDPLAVLPEQPEDETWHADGKEHLCIQSRL